MTSDVFYELSKDHLLTAIQSDYLQVTCSYSRLQLVLLEPGYVIPLLEVLGSSSF